MIWSIKRLIVQASEIIWCKLAINPPVPSVFLKITKRYKSLSIKENGFVIIACSKSDKFWDVLNSTTSISTKE